MRLRLRHTWTTVMSSSDTRDTILVRYARDGIVGLGEGAPIKRYNETAQDAVVALASVRPLILAGDPWQHRELMAQVMTRLPGQWALKAALDAALMDWVGKRLGVPLYRYLGLDPRKAPVTTFSIGIDSPEMTRQKVREAAEFPVLKIKVGLSTDEASIAAVRSQTSKPLRVDANEGWQSKEEALRKIKWLETQGVELIEQPLPAAMHDEMRWLRERVKMPIFADESCLHPSDIPRLADAYDGINVKLDKCGGVWEALRMIHTARAHGMKVMLGCMISSSLDIAAAAHLSPLVDYADLDGFLLIDNDPFSGLRADHGKLILSAEPGLGVSPRGPR
jgi:L-alanine-DL-glutamate epimerase-like enolase superfamily enzyme